MSDRNPACIDTYLSGDEPLTVTRTVDITETIEAEMRDKGFSKHEVARQVEAFLAGVNDAMVRVSLAGGQVGWIRRAPWRPSGSCRVSSIIEGYQNMVWVISKCDSTETISEERVPQAEMSEDDIVAYIEAKAKTELTAREIAESPHLYGVRKDEHHGNRLSYEAGENPYYTAALYRPDELIERPKK
jgi:hypothetical protein